MFACLDVELLEVEVCCWNDVDAVYGGYVKNERPYMNRSYWFRDGTEGGVRRQQRRKERLGPKVCV